LPHCSGVLSIFEVVYAIGNGHEAQIEWMACSPCRTACAETCNGLMVWHANAKPVFIIFCVPLAASPVTLGILTITLHLISVSQVIFCHFLLASDTCV
jgi:hypothetical protein